MQLFILLMLYHTYKIQHDIFFCNFELYIVYLNIIEMTLFDGVGSYMIEKWFFEFQIQLIFGADLLTGLWG